ncbi:MAG: hypothetical protein IT454_10705 [Planctomycetes bacterium]|nr:hypothetical protein [Planctomycetota bacterium]
MAVAVGLLLFVIASGAVVIAAREANRRRDAESKQLGAQFVNGLESTNDRWWCDLADSEYGMRQHWRMLVEYIQLFRGTYYEDATDDEFVAALQALLSRDLIDRVNAVLIPASLLILHLSEQCQANDESEARERSILIHLATNLDPPRWAADLLNCAPSQPTPDSCADIFSDLENRADLSSAEAGWIAPVLLALGREDQAVWLAEQALKADSACFGARWVLGSVLLLKERPEDESAAFEHLGAAAALRPQSVETSAKLSTAYMRRKLVKPAKRVFANAIRFNPKHVDVLMASVNAVETQEAIETIDAAMRVSGDSLEVGRNAVNTLINLRMFDDAVRVAYEFDERITDKAGWAYYLARALDSAGCRQEAVDAYCRSNQWEGLTNASNGLLERAFAHPPGSDLNTSLITQALHFAERAFAQESQDPSVVLNLFAAKASAGEVRGALELLQVTLPGLPRQEGWWLGHLARFRELVVAAGDPELLGSTDETIAFVRALPPR